MHPAPRFHLTRSVVVNLAVIALLTSPSAGAELSREEQKCVATQTKAVARQARAAVNELTRCARRAAKGKELDRSDPSIQSIDACVLEDPRGKLEKLAAKMAAKQTRRCPAPGPSFGVTDAANAGNRATTAALDLVHDVLGPDLGPGSLATERRDVRCQQAVWGAATRCQRTRLSEFARCQKAALRGGASSADELAQTCLGIGSSAQPDPKGTIARTCTDPSRGIAKALGKKCADVDLVPLFPPCATADDPAACIAAHAACRSCEALSLAGLLARDCDLFDDGLANTSCDGPPQLVCVAPAQGAMVQVADGEAVTFVGRVENGVGIDEVNVDGTPVPVAEDGSFQLPVTTTFGGNFVSLVAADDLGRSLATTCGFVASESYLPEDAQLPNAFSLKLRAPAIDDGSREDLDSLGDLLHTVINSSGLVSQFDAILEAANPLKASSCDSTVLNICVLRSEVLYLSLAVDGPNSTSLSLVTNGLDGSATVRNAGIRVRVRGQVAGIPYDTTGWVTFSFVQGGQIEDLGLVGGAVSVSPRPGSTSVGVGTITTDFTGLDGAILDIVSGLFNDSVRNLATGAVVGFLEHQFGDLLESIIDNLDPPDRVVPVPRFGDANPVLLSIESAWSAVSVTTARARFGLGTRFAAADDHGLPSLGVPLVPNPTSDDPPTSAPALLAARLDLLNQALHALWRGGLLHGSLGDGDAIGLPAGFSVEIEASLPPVATSVEGETLALDLVGLRALVTLPGVFDVPTQLVVGARATAALSIVDDRLVFDTPTVLAIHLGGVDSALDAAQQNTLEAAVSSILERILDDALVAGSLGLGIPAFVLPPEAGTYGLPAGAEIGLVGPLLSSTASHALAEGPIGIR